MIIGLRIVLSDVVKSSINPETLIPRMISRKERILDILKVKLFKEDIHQIRRNECLIRNAY